jgi:hypothetical protein
LRDAVAGNARLVAYVKESLVVSAGLVPDSRDAC